MAYQKAPPRSLRKRGGAALRRDQLRGRSRRSGGLVAVVAELAVLLRLLHLGQADLAVVVGVGDLDVLPALVTDLVLGEKTVAVLVCLLESLGGVLRLLLGGHRGVVTALAPTFSAAFGERNRG